MQRLLLLAKAQNENQRTLTNQNDHGMPSSCFFAAQTGCKKRMHKPRIYHSNVCHPLRTIFAQSMNLRNQGYTYLSFFLRVLRATSPTPHSNIMFCSKRTPETRTACHKGRIDLTHEIVSCDGAFLLGHQTSRVLSFPTCNVIGCLKFLYPSKVCL